MAEWFYWFDRGPRVEGSRIIRNRSGHITRARMFTYSYIPDGCLGTDAAPTVPSIHLWSAGNRNGQGRSPAPRRDAIKGNAAPAQ